MGWFMRLQLQALPIVDIDNMGEALLSLASVSIKPEVLKQIRADHKAQQRRYCKEYRSLAEIDTHAIEAKNDWMWRGAGYHLAWKRVGPYLVLFRANRTSAWLGVSFPACECIIRTGPSNWRVCDLSVIERDIQDSNDSTLATSQYPYVGSLNSDIFHLSDKPCAKRITLACLISFDSREEAIESGYEPCKRCKP